MRWAGGRGKNDVVENARATNYTRHSVLRTNSLNLIQCSVLRCVECKLEHFRRMELKITTNDAFISSLTSPNMCSAILRVADKNTHGIDNNHSAHTRSFWHIQQTNYTTH